MIRRARGIGESAYNRWTAPALLERAGSGILGTAISLEDGMQILRTLLFVPADRPDMMEKARGSGADALVLDLEDAVLPGRKASARQAAAEALVAPPGGEQQLFVRLNSIESGLTRDDLLAVTGNGLSGVILPKTEAAQDLRDLDVLLREAEMERGVRPGTVTVLPLIESPRALLRCEEVARATDRLVGLSLGGEDYSHHLGVSRDVAGVALFHARAVIATVAAAYDLLAIDTPYAALRDVEGLATEARSVRAMGFKGKYAVHPAQIDPLNQAFSPSIEDVARARQVVEAFEQASANGSGAVQLDGAMVDAPVAARAQRLIAMAEEMAARRR